jgi:hypothetical protein
MPFEIGSVCLSHIHMVLKKFRQHQATSSRNRSDFVVVKIYLFSAGDFVAFFEPFRRF